MTVNGLRDFIYMKGVEFNKKALTSLKHQKKRFTKICKQINRKIPDPSNTKGYYQSYLKKKTRIGKTIKNSFSRTKNFKKPKHC